MGSPPSIKLSETATGAFAQADATHLQLARQTMSGFITYVMRDEQTGLPLQMAPIHRSWHSLAEQHSNLLIWSHIESGKTSQLTIARTLWRLGRDPSLRIAIISNTAGQADKILGAIKKYIESSERLHKVFPNLRPGDKWTNSAISVRRPTISKDASIQATGLHGNILGSRLDLIVLDDILDYENTRTSSGREDTWGWLQASVFSRLTDRGRLLCVGTAFHPDDALHRMAKLPGFKAFRYPVLDDEGNSRWPQRWPLERIEAAKVRLGPLEFARQLRCLARSDDESRFKKEWIDSCLARGSGKQLCYGMERLPPGFKTYTGVDLAVQQKDGSDMTCLFTIAAHPNGDREVLNIESGKFAGPDIVQKIIDSHRRYLSICIVENNACFVPGTRVLTKEGYKPIEAVDIGDLVWTHKGRWRKVTGTHEGIAQTVVEANAKGCIPVITTPNHWFWLREAGKVGSARGPLGEPQWVSYGLRDKSAYAAIAIPKWEAAKPILRLEGRGKQAARAVKVTEEIAVLLGLYMAQGHSTQGQVFWTLDAKKKYLAKFVAEVLSEVVSGKVSFVSGEGTIRVRASSTSLAQALKIGVGDKKCLPLEWMGWPLKLRLALVRGWLLGDGCVTLNNAKTRWPQLILRGDSISRDWIMFVRSTLAQAGIPSALNFTEPKMGLIQGRTVTRKMMFSLALTREGSWDLRKHMSLPVEAARWKKWFTATAAPARKSNGLVILDGDHAWSRVPEMEQSPFRDNKGGPVFNLTVEEDESYTVEDFIVHNAQDFIVQFARGAFAVPIRPFTTGRNKAHPEFGVESIAAEMAGRKWIIPSSNGHAAHPEIGSWIQEMLFYQPSSHTGDRLMASWFAREGVRLGTYKVDSGRIDVMAR